MSPLLTCSQCGNTLDASGYPTAVALRCPDCRTLLRAAAEPAVAGPPVVATPVRARPPLTKAERSEEPPSEPPRPNPWKPSARPKPGRRIVGLLAVAGVLVVTTGSVGAVAAWYWLEAQNLSTGPIPVRTPTAVPSPPTTRANRGRPPVPQAVAHAPQPEGLVIDPGAIPQDQKLAGKLRADHVAWARRGTLDVFDQFGNTKAPWADKARAAIEAYARRSARSGYVPHGVEHQELLAAVEAAAAAGCDDPLVGYLNVRFLVPHRAAEAWKKVDPDAQAVGLRQAAREMAASKYHPVWRAHAAWNIWADLGRIGADKKGLVSEEELASVEKQFWAAFTEAARDDNRFTRSEVFDVANLAIEDAHTRTGDRAAGWRKIDDILTAVNAPAWTRNAIEGEFLIHYAWDARGVGVAGTVTPDGWKRLGERLHGAEECFEEAWRLDPTLPQPAARMVTVAMGQSFSRKDMERWFNRAMEADPDCWSACLAKREWLQPKWHGQDRDVYFFCQRCLYTRNWYAGLPFIAQQVYAGSQMNTDEDYRQYYGHETIWRYTQEAYTGFLAEYPTDRDARTRYAYIAARVGKWDVAAEQFEALGDVPWPGHFASREEFDRLRAEARKHARGK